MLMFAPYSVMLFSYPSGEVSNPPLVVVRCPPLADGRSRAPSGLPALAEPRR
jgi:hypothetical protein